MRSGRLLQVRSLCSCSCCWSCCLLLFIFTAVQAAATTPDSYTAGSSRLAVHQPWKAASEGEESFNINKHDKTLFQRHITPISARARAGEREVSKAPPTASTTSSAACKLPANQSVYLSEGFGYELDCAPSVGSLNGYMFFVDFPDETANETTTQGLYDVFLPEAASWYYNSSFGKLALNVTADTSRFYRMPRNADSYGWQRGLTSEMHLAYIQDAVDAYFNATVPDFDFSNNHVLYIVPTANASSISFSPTYMDPISATIPTSNTTVQLAKKVVTFGLDAYITWHYKTLNHETGHTMCLPDLYPIDGRRTGLWVGGWDLQGYINGPSPDYFAWHKWKLGWIEDEQIDCVELSGQVTPTSTFSANSSSTTYTLSPLELSSSGPNTKALVLKPNSTSTTLLVAEARTTLDLDASACTGPGVLLYTVSTLIDTGEGPIKVIDANPGSGGCGGDELDDAVLRLGSTNGTDTWMSDEWGIRITVVGKEEEGGEGFVVRVDVGL